MTSSTNAKCSSTNAKCSSTNAKCSVFDETDIDIETLVDNIHSSVVLPAGAINRVFILQNIIIKSIELDILFRYEKNDTGLLIDINFFQDNLLDINENNISLFNIITSHKTGIHTPREFIKISLLSLLEIIPTLDFDCLIGRFIPNDINEVSSPKEKCGAYFLHKKNSKLQNATERIFQKIGITVNNKSKDCCVCYEKTNCATACNHYLCFLCCAQITLDEETGEVPCPICRSQILFSKTGGCH